MIGDIVSLSYELSDTALLSIGRFRAREVADWIREYYGKRCEEFSEDCPCCQKWQAFDVLFKDVK